jgi:SAM-dependent methyltransferase
LTDALDQGQLVSANSRPPAVLDVGYGTGYWLYDMREMYRAHRLVGVDIAASTRDMCGPGQNIYFKDRFNFEQDPWPFSDGEFDFIHMAGLCGSVSDWTKLCSTALRWVSGH